MASGEKGKESVRELDRTPTESVLRDWREGSTRAERLAAAVLQLDGFTDVDPQAPLGGPDGGKDILCAKGATKYVGAAYFPTEQVTFAKIKAKFRKDLKKAKRHNREGLVFVTNQAIGPNHRATLEQIASDNGMDASLLHRERMRNLLDSPAGYGVRLEFLRIPMKEEEQFAYFASSGKKLEYALERQASAIRSLARRIQILGVGQKYMATTMYQMVTNRNDEVSPPPDLDAGYQVDQLRVEDVVEPLSAALTPSLLLFVHRVVCTDLPSRFLGKFRDRTAWVGGPGTTEEDATLVFPPPDRISGCLQEILAAWNQGFPVLLTASSTEKLDAVARFHHRLVALHPFTDGNGRAARTLLMQQCMDLFGQIDPALLDSGADYYRALRNADQDEFSLLVELISRAVNQ